MNNFSISFDDIAANTTTLGKGHISVARKLGFIEKYCNKNNIKYLTSTEEALNNPIFKKIIVDFDSQNDLNQVEKMLDVFCNLCRENPRFFMYMLPDKSIEDEIAGLCHNNGIAFTISRQSIKTLFSFYRLEHLEEIKRQFCVATEIDCKFYIYYQSDLVCFNTYDSALAFCNLQSIKTHPIKKVGIKLEPPTIIMDALELLGL